MSTSALPSHRFEDRLPIDVFVVSPNARLRQELQEKLTLPRWQMLQAISGAGALELLRRHGGEDVVLLLDPLLPDLEPNGFNAIVKDRFPNTQVLMLNSATGQLLIGSASPTPVSARLADVVNQNGTASSSVIPAALPETPHYPGENRTRLRNMVGDSEPMQRMYAVTRMVAARDTTVEEVNRILREAAASGPLRGILAYNDEPLVSVDFNHNAHSSIFDATLTKVSGRLVKVSSWYDNEWGFSNRMLDTTVALMKA